MRQFSIAAVLGVAVLASGQLAHAKPAASKAECRSVCGQKITEDCGGLRGGRRAACKAREVRQCRKVGTAGWCGTALGQPVSPECTRTPSNLPTQLTLTVPLVDPNNPARGNGSDLDNGVSGLSHNFPILGGSTLKYCLSGCDQDKRHDVHGYGDDGRQQPERPDLRCSPPLGRGQRPRVRREPVPGLDDHEHVRPGHRQEHGRREALLRRLHHQLAGGLPTLRRARG